MNRLFNPELIRIVDGFESKDECLRFMAGLLQKNGCLGNAEPFLAVIQSREQVMSTGIGRAVAIPHGRSADVNQLCIAVCLLKSGLDFDSVDAEPVRIIFMLAVPDDGNKMYMKVLRGLAEYLRQDSLREKLINANSERELIDYVFEIEAHIHLHA